MRAPGASAHAALIRAEPAENAFVQQPPPAITVAFSEPVELRQSGIRLVDATGQDVPLPAPKLADASTIAVTPPKLPPGIYNVLWYNVSRIDGHAWRGAYPFTVLNPDGSLPRQANALSGLDVGTDPAPVAEQVAVRALGFLGLLIAAGGAVLLLSGAASDGRMRSVMARGILLGAAVLAAATVLNLFTLREVYDGVGLRGLLFQTRSGGYLLARAGAVMFVAVLVSFVGDAPRRAATATLVALLAYVYSYAATSHAAAGTGSTWATAFDLVHGLAAIVWIGAVVGVALAARAAWQHGTHRGTLARFSRVASVSVFLLLATGFLSALIEINTPGKLVDTRYGLTLVTKLGLMVPLLAVAAYNARTGKVKLAASGPGEPRRFLYTATAEALLGLGVFVLAAMLTQTTVAKSIVETKASKPYANTTSVSDLSVGLSVDPNRTGLNTYRVTVSDKAGQPVDPQRVRITFRYLEDQTVGASNLVLQKTSAGTYAGAGPYLTLEGNWRLEVEIRRADVDDVLAFFAVRPAGLQVVSDVRGGRWDNPAPGLTANQFAGIAALIVAGGFALFRKELAKLGKRSSMASTGMTALAFGIGTLLLFGVHKDAVPVGALPNNPIFPDQNSVAKGKTLYEQNCAACHGQRGVPPKGLDLNPYPLDLTVHVPQHPDGSLYNFIKNGVPNSAMRAWGQGDGKFTDEQLWHLVNYLRTLGEASQ